MIVYTDLLNGSEMCTDSHHPKFICDGAVMSVEAKMVYQGGEEINIGGNASAEEETEALDDQKVQVVNILAAHKLQKMEIDKKDYQDFLKAYIKLLNEKLADDKKASLKAHQTSLLKWLKEDVFPAWKEFECFIGSEGSLDCSMIVLARWFGDAPTFYYIADGLKPIKF